MSLMNNKQKKDRQPGEAVKLYERRDDETRQTWLSDKTTRVVDNSELIRLNHSRLLDTDKSLWSTHKASIKKFVENEISNFQWLPPSDRWTCCGCQSSTQLASVEISASKSAPLINFSMLTVCSNLQSHVQLDQFDRNVSALFTNQNNVLESLENTHTHTHDFVDENDDDLLWEALTNWIYKKNFF